MVAALSVYSMGPARDGPDILGLSAARLASDNPDRDRLRGYLVPAVGDGLLSASPSPVRLGLAQLLKTSTPSPTPATPPPTPVAELPSVQARNPGQVSAQLSVDVRAVVCADWTPWTCAWALAVVACESGGDPASDSNWPYVGLWQIDSVLHAALAESLAADLYTPEGNTVVAAALFGGRGAAHWGCSGH